MVSCKCGFLAPGGEGEAKAGTLLGPGPGDAVLAAAMERAVKGGRGGAVFLQEEQLGRSLTPFSSLPPSPHPPASADTE